MRDLMSNRGPDSFGTSVFQNVYLGHRRLAIQDLSPSGSQPSCSPCGRFCFIFNGEIYNHFALRELLPPDEQQFLASSSSDTLTLSYLLSYFSLDDLLHRLSGMFVLIIYDRVENVIHACRDRFGEKPCFIAHKKLFDHDFLIFSSTLSAFQNLDFNSSEINYSAVYHYLSFQSSPSSSTIFSSISKLLPGTCSTYSLRSLALIDSFRFWSPFDSTPVSTSSSSPNSYSFPDLISTADNIFQNSFEKSLCSDVPLSILLSGGIESTIFAKYSSAYSTISSPITCFTIKSIDS